MSKNEDLHTPKVLKSTVEYSGFFSITKDELISSHGVIYDYFSLKTKGDAVIILAKTEDDQFVLIEEYRHPVEAIIISCPGGYIENREDPLIAAKRELEEETGYSADNYELIGEAYPYAGISSQRLYYVLATGAKKRSEQNLDRGEVVKVAIKSEEKVRKALRDKSNHLDGNMCTALCFYQFVSRDKLNNYNLSK